MSAIDFHPPGPGVWELEQTHFARPATRFASAVLPGPLAKGFGEGTRRYGLLLDTLEARPVNDFIYVKFRPVGAPEKAKGPPPKFLFQLMTRLHPEIRRRVKTAPTVFESKLWREDMKRWDEQYKPDSISRNRRLQQTPVATLAESDLIQHLDAVRDNAAEMVYRHHIFTISCCFPVGHFLAETQRLTGLPSGEVLGLLKGAAPVSRGVAAQELSEVQAAMTQTGIKAGTFAGQPARTVLDQLQSIDGVGGPLRRFLEIVGYRLVSGYDIAEKYALEMPDMLVQTLFEGAADPAGRQADFEQRRDTIRSRVPQADRGRFDELLEEARFIHRLRDERGVFNDLWAMGLARRAYLEAGRRLHEAGALPDAYLAVYCSPEELADLLRGSRGPSVEELRRRHSWRESKTTSDAPPFLGGTPAGPPPLDWLPAPARPNAVAINTALHEIFHVPTLPATATVLQGIPVHPGRYEGIARIVNGPDDFDRLQPGDVLVARNTGPAFNVVLPLLGAIVTDRGGQLSHAAIVAREYGIPAVVGTREATTKFPDGARVRVNGDKGEVELLP